MGFLKTAFQRFQEQNMQHHAAALTYYTVLGLFPALLFAASLLGLLGSGETVGAISRFMLEQGADKSVVEGVSSAISTAVSADKGSLIALIFSLLLALNAASGGVGAVSLALDIVQEQKDQSNFFKKKLRIIGITLVLIALALGAVVAVFLGGGFAQIIFDWMGLGETAASIWSVARWPIALMLALTAFSWLYYAAPSNKRKWKWLSIGSFVAMTIWIMGSVGFFFYVSNFGSYNATYGVFATAIILLVWLWLTNIALLFGAEVNAVKLEAKAAKLAQTKSTKAKPDVIDKTSSEESDPLPGKAKLLGIIVAGGYLLNTLRKK